MPKNTYFSEFPVIKYGNSSIIDITKRIALLDSVSNNPYVFYPYDIAHNERPDQLSYRYYRDQYKSWLIYLTNKIVDPYYDWYLHPREFDEFLTGKYGSLENAYNKIAFYRHNWANSEDISISAYNALAVSQQKYWTPVYSVSNNITSYTRKKENWSINTNKIVKYTSSNTSFTNNEICDIIFDNDNTGIAQVLYTTNTSVYVQHTVGVTVSNDSIVITANSYLYGRETLVNTSFSNSSLIVSNISAEEEIYWEPITYFNLETEKNEFNKTIRLLDNRLMNQTILNFRDIMQ